MGNYLARPTEMHRTVTACGMDARNFSLISERMLGLSTRSLESIRMADDYLIVWLDSKIKEDKRLHAVIRELSSRSIPVQPMYDYDKWMEFLRNHNHFNKIILVFSSEFDGTFLGKVEHVPFIIGTYRYVWSGDADDILIEHYMRMDENTSYRHTALETILYDLSSVKDDPSKLIRHAYSAPQYYDKLVSSKQGGNSKLQTSGFRRELQQELQGPGVCSVPLPLKYYRNINELTFKGMLIYLISIMKKKLSISENEIDYQIILIDISKHLNEFSTILLKNLLHLAGYSIPVFDNTQLIDFNLSPEKATTLFVSSEFASTMDRNRHKYIKAVYILEIDKTKADQRERFATPEDLLYQLADELYRALKREADYYKMKGDKSNAERKQAQADRIHDQLKQVYINHSALRSEPIIPTTTILVWLAFKTPNYNTVDKVQKLFDSIISSFVVFENELKCCEFLSQTSTTDGIFLVISDDYENSTVENFEKLTNNKAVYYYGPRSVAKKTHIANYNALCSRLACDLIAHYKQLGDNYKKDKKRKEAADMFMKAHELCKILGDL